MRKSIWLGLATAAIVACSGGDAHADAQDIIPPSTRPGFFNIGFGPSFYGLNSNNGRRFGRGGALTRGKLIFDFGYHLEGSGEGPAVGATVEQTIDDNFYVFNPGFKFYWDIEIADLAIYATPQGKAGFALGTCNGCDPQPAFNIGFGAEGRVVFKDRWMTFFRPIYLDTYLGDFFGETFLLNYDILIGGGVTF